MDDTILKLITEDNIDILDNQTLVKIWLSINPSHPLESKNTYYKAWESSSKGAEDKRRFFKSVILEYIRFQKRVKDNERGQDDLAG